MFSSFQVSNYRNLPAQEIRFKSLNIFIGPNNSGKSNLIESFSFLKDALDKGFYGACRERGFTEFLNCFTELPASVDFKWVFSFPGVNPLRYQLSLEIYQRDEAPVIKYERLGYDEPRSGPYRKSHFNHVEAHRDIPGEALFAFYSKKKEKIVSKKFYLSTREIFLNQIDKLELPEDLKQILIPRSITLASEVRNFVNKWFIYRNANIDIEKSKKVLPRDDMALYLNDRASNLSQVFFNLENDERYYSQLKKIIFKMKSIIPQLEDIKSIIKGGDYVEILFYLKGSKRGLRLREISDGTVRMLILALILFHPEPPVLVMIDEPELNLHPAWLKTVAEWLKEASEKTQIVFSTHSPDLLDNFTDQLENVFVFNTKSERETEISFLARERLAPFLEEGWQLGDLYRVGEPEVGGWPW